MSSSPDAPTPQHRGFLAWWARNSVAANLLMVIALVGGLIGYNTLQRETFPSAEWTGVSVSIGWPGASPQEVEEQLILRVEESISDLEGIEELTATAVEGRGWVNIEAERSVDMTAFVDEVKLRVDSINNLPRESFRPIVERWRNEDQAFLMALHGDVDRRELQRLAEEIRDEVASTVPEASLVITQARLSEEVAIELSEDALNRYGLTFSEVSRAIQASSLNASAGSVRTDQGDVALTSRQLADTAEDFEGIVLRQTAEGGLVRVGDVARVTDGLSDFNLDASFSGEQMVLIDVRAVGSTDVVTLAEQMNAYIANKQAELPSTVSLTPWFQSADLYTSRMETIANSAGLGLALVLAVLILFLRPVVALWVTIGIATAFAGALMLLPFLGVTLNMLSLFAFLIVIGVVVDDAIIVGENIHNRVERGERGMTAAVVGVQMVAKPVVFAVITTMMAFAPWMLLSGPEVQFTRQISLVVIAALTFSLIESLLILPAHLAHIGPQKTDGRLGWLIRTQTRVADVLMTFAHRVYAPFLAMSIRRRYSTLVTFIGLFALAITLITTGRVPFRFMPEVENELVQVRIALPEGTPWERTLAVRDQLENAREQVVLEYRESYPDYVDMVENNATITTDGSIRSWVKVAAPELRPQSVSTREVSEALRTALGPIPDAEEIDFDFTINESSSGMAFALNHPDLDVLRQAADDLKDRLRSYDTTFDVIDNLQTSADELQFTLRPDAQALGLTLRDVANQVRQAFYGDEVQRLPRDGEDVRVMVRYPEELRENIDALSDFRVRMPDGREIPLASVAEIEYAPGINRINRRERQRTVTVRAELTDPDSAGEIRRDLQQNFFPELEERYPGLSEGEIGEAQGQREFMAELQTLQIIMLGSMYVLLAVAFRSYWQPLLIMTAIPFAFAGAVFGHMLFGMPLALFSFFGVGAAAGVVINDNLVLVDFVNRLRERGVGAFQALVDAGVQRFRPILLTSVTTFIGVLPMMAERSTQAQFLKPMVVALGFAVIFALFLSLLLVPALYAIGVDVGRFVKRLWTGEKQPALGASYSGHESGPDGVDVASPAYGGKRRPVADPGATPQPAE